MAQDTSSSTRSDLTNQLVRLPNACFFLSRSYLKTKASLKFRFITFDFIFGVISEIKDKKMVVKKGGQIFFSVKLHFEGTLVYTRQHIIRRRSQIKSAVAER